MIRHILIHFISMCIRSCEKERLFWESPIALGRYGLLLRLCARFTERIRLRGRAIAAGNTRGVGKALSPRGDTGFCFGYARVSLSAYAFAAALLPRAIRAAFGRIRRFRAAKAAASNRRDNRRQISAILCPACGEENAPHAADERFWIMRRGAAYAPSAHSLPHKKAGRMPITA